MNWYPLYRRHGGRQVRSGQVREISSPPGVAIPTGLSQPIEKFIKRDKISFTPSRKGRKHFGFSSPWRLNVVPWRQICVYSQYGTRILKQLVDFGEICAPLQGLAADRLPQLRFSQNQQPHVKYTEKVMEFLVFNVNVTGQRWPALTCPHDCAGSQYVLHQQFLSLRVIHQPVLDVRAPYNLQWHVTL